MSYRPQATWLTTAAPSQTGNAPDSGPAAAILTTRTVAVAIHPTRALMVVFNRALLLRLGGVLLAFFSHLPDIEEAYFSVRS